MSFGLFTWSSLLLSFAWFVCIQSFIYRTSIAKIEKSSPKRMIPKSSNIIGGAQKVSTYSARSRYFATISQTINSLQDQDPEIYDLIEKEWNRQFTGIELIASENFASAAVLSALGSCLTNKYSEGQPLSRYYGGNQYIDQIELLCQKRALELFSLRPEEWSVNVQPYSGSPANFAVYTALLKPHDRIMGLDLPSGGHLTHGYQTLKRKVSATSIFFESLPYRVNPVTGLIDYDEMQKLAELFKPKLLIAGASAYPRDWDYCRMRKIANSVGAYLMADIAHISGLVATKQANNPFEYCDIVTTTTHKSLRGPRAGMIFSKRNISDLINLAVFPALQGGPHNHQIAAIAIALKEANTIEFTQYIAQVKKNAIALGKGLQSYGYKLFTDGTENHLLLWDIRNTGVSSSKLEKLFEICDISVNKNSIPGDISALNPGGIRLGTPAMTTRGMKEEEMKYIATLLHRIVLIGKKIQQILSNQLSSSSEGNSNNVGKLKEFLDVIDNHKSIQQEIDGMKKEIRQFSQSYILPGFPMKRR